MKELTEKFKVRANGNYEKYNITDAVLGRTPAAGEEFVVTGDRLNVLLGNNSHHISFVDVVERIEEPKPEKPKTSRRKAAKK